MAEEQRVLAVDQRVTEVWIGGLVAHQGQAVRHVRVPGGPRAQHELTRHVLGEGDDRVGRQVRKRRLPVNPHDRSAIAARHPVADHLVGWADQDVDLSHVGLPAGRGGLRVQAVGIQRAVPELLLEFVVLGVRRGIAPPPEEVDEVGALLLGLERLVGLVLFLGDDVADRPLPPSRGRLVDVDLVLGLSSGGHPGQRDGQAEG